MSSVTSGDVVVFAVVSARFLLPLLIPKYPLPGVIASIMVDSADQSIFRALLGVELPGYQPYDKALDVYSLSITMLAVLRNWQNLPAVEIARLLFYIRLAGVLAFEITGWRPYLLIFPNTFEYFFIFYEVVRAWWSPARLGTRSLLVATAAIWVVIKVPQEYLLHVARLDLTDLIKATVLHRMPVTSIWAEGLAQLLSVALAVVGVALLGLLVRAMAAPGRHPLRVAADPVAVTREWAGRVATRWHVFDRHLLEKVVLVGALTVIFAQIVPGIDASPMQLVGGVAVIATWNSLLLLRWARKGRPVPPAVLSFCLLAITNAGFVLAADLMLRRYHAGMPVSASVFFLLLLSLVVTLYDRWYPLFDERLRKAGAA